MSDPNAILPRRIRDTFEQFGVIKPVAWPKLDLLAKAITARKYRYEVSTGPDGTASARITAMGETYTAVDGEPERALAKAFHACLKETGSAQVSFLAPDAGDDDEEAAEDDEEPDAVTIDRTPLPPDLIRFTGRAMAQVAGGEGAEASEELVMRDGVFYGAETGVRFDPIVSAQLAGAQARVLAEQKRR